MLVIKSAGFNSKKRSWIKFNKDQILLDRGINLEKLIDFKNSQAYLAKVDNGNTAEYINDLIIEKQFMAPSKKPVTQKNTEEAIALFSEDVDRFIAHAGGAVEGNRYTNSLEALNASYEKGFRLFELDIIKTSDGEFVAAHDWNTWQEQTGYQGVTPVSLEVFNRHKILKKFNSLDMRAINRWFSSHKDAVLITDKTRDIEQFANSFVDQQRLRMEIFTLPDVIIAATVGVEPMLSGDLLNKLNNDTLEYVQKHDINYAVFSRKSIPKNKKLLDQLSQVGVKTYVYHVNFQVGKDESYVVKYELGTVYGMYADDWKFKN